MPLEKYVIQQIATNSISPPALNSMQIDDTKEKELAEALKTNHNITALYLCDNQIGDAGVQAMAEALKINKSIVSFGTSFNNIGDIVKKEIETALQINKDFPAEAKKEALEKQIAEQARQKEAERFEKEAKLREQEEAEAAKEAAKLKAIEEAKVKEYIPDIPVVKLFEVAGGDNLFDNDDQTTIKKVLNLIRDGNDRLQEHGKKGILLLGNTGAGKSTLAHLFSGKKLQAIMDDETALSKKLCKFQKLGH